MTGPSGENQNSLDSSAHMCNPNADCNQDPYVPVDLVVGKVFVLIWPASRFGFLHRPDTFGDVPAPDPDATVTPTPTP